MSTIEADLLVGCAQMLAALPANGDGARRTKYTYRTDAPYVAADGFGLYADLAEPNDLPSIVVAEYPVSADLVGGDEVVGVQFRIASKDRLAVKHAIADLRDHLHGRWGGSLGSVTLIQATRSSGTNVGQDANGRLVRTENYYLTIYRP